MRDAYILEACRTPMGKNRGVFADVRSDELLAQCLNAIVERTKIDAARVDDVVGGCVTQTQEQGCNVIRNAVLAAGWPESVPGTSVNRLCGSSQQAVSFAAMEVMSGQADLTVGCGTESMTRVPMGSDVGAFHPELDERFDLVPQGESSELMADRYGITREMVDQLSAESHRRALHAAAEGYFDREIVPVLVTDRTTGKLLKKIEKDEGPRADTSVEKIGGLKTIFRADGGITTAGSSSQISDGAAAILIGTKEIAAELGLTPRARIVATAAVGTNPTIMLEGPIPATRKVLDRAGLKLEDIDAFEVNEAFASVVCAWENELGVDHSKVNLTGGAVALGHPLGASGARLLVTLLHEIERQGMRYGLSTMCIGFGQGTGTIIERVG